MTGTKPTNIIARDFRGARLYLQSLHIGNGMRWGTNLQTALKLTMPEAFKVCEQASREWGTRCAVVDSEGNLAQPEGNVSAVCPRCGNTKVCECGPRCTCRYPVKQFGQHRLDCPMRRDRV